jgi:hypothetical protein
MTDENTTTASNAEDSTGLDLSEFTADRVRGADGKFVSRMAQAKGAAPRAELKKEQASDKREAEPGQVETPEDKHQAQGSDGKQEEQKPPKEDKAEEAEVVKSDKLRRVLELEAKARDTAQRVEQREKEVVQFYEVAKQFEQKLVERERALAEKEKTWTADAIHSDPIGWLLDHNVDPDRLLQSLADSDGRRKAVEARRPDPREETIAQLQARLERLEKEGPEWLTKQRQQEQEKARAASVAEAEQWFVSQAQDAKRYPSIMRVLDADEVVPKVRAILQEAKRKGEPLDDEAVMGRLETTCSSKLERIMSDTGQQGAKAKGQAAGVQESSSREPESSLSSVLSGQRAELPQRRPRAERLKDFDLGKIVIKDD